MSVKPVKVGLIGSGAISGTYLNNMINRFKILEVVGCSDIIPERSAKRAEEFNIRDMTNEQIYSDPEIEIVVNTTYPTAHYEVSKAALLAGKHVISEKMIAVTLEEGRDLLKTAEDKNLRFGAAPDTFLGAAHQTARKLLDDGYIGEPCMVQAMVTRGYHPDYGAWPNMHFISLPGGGLPFDMGGYYLHAVLDFLGPVTRCTGFAQTRRQTRKFANPRNPKYGEEFFIDTINQLAGTLEFKNGMLGNIALTGDGFEEVPRIEIYGTEGTLIVPDPNNFGGDVYLKRIGKHDRYLMPPTHGYGEGCCRGLGVADMAWAIRNSRPHRASGDMALHAFEIIHSIWGSGKNGTIHKMETGFIRPAALQPGGIDDGMAENRLAN
ncbi:MAG: Gfo/Idh/MocA family oxidoreductase [Oscillospiraceae bacterium]|nr:Gfo/Idh/MocA family oxidoreductase [Oscillospiraceae bacterium]